MTSTSTTISDSGALGIIRAADAAATERAAIVAATEADAADIRGRRAQIAAALADHNAKRPAPDPDVSDELADMLAANPSAARSADWIGRVRAMQAGTAAAIDEWEAERAILAQADDKLAGVAQEIAARLMAEREAHEAAYLEFLTVTRAALIDEFEARWDAIADEVLQPLAAVMNAPKLYLPGRHQLPYAKGIWEEGTLSLFWPEPETPGGRGWKRLYPVDRARVPSDAVATLLAAIREPSPAPAIRTQRRAA
ncbi:hypothetical protein [Sphingomonas sp. BE137]|uniref:hypothetical protein n=1 Tax=Sphingomonas sp. BE137 TaxID=2817844 RepID=UPI001AE1D668|nr:hypothetical protein [Sphingomonas sp. BE137]MDR6850358.1 hypothetical protein [Sphingomonas sp. BE137]